MTAVGERDGVLLRHARREDLTTVDELTVNAGSTGARADT
jgi:hypothetical protein